MTDRLTDQQVAETLTGWHHDSRTHRLAREVQASRKLIADLLALHAPFPCHCLKATCEATICDSCEDEYPCPTVRLIEAVVA